MVQHSVVSLPVTYTCLPTPFTIHYSSLQNCPNVRHVETNWLVTQKVHIVITMGNPWVSCALVLSLHPYLLQPVPMTQQVYLSKQTKKKAKTVKN